MGALNLEDGKTSDGIQQVFATNLFGHFVMVMLCFMSLFNQNKLSGPANQYSLDKVKTLHGLCYSLCVFYSN